MEKLMTMTKKCWKRGNAMSLLFDMLTHRVWNNSSYHMEKLMPGIEKLLGKLLFPEGKLFDSEGESCFSERSEAKHSPEESKSLPEGIKSA